MDIVTFKINKRPWEDNRQLFSKGTLTLTEGETYCFVGCNGTGKTTLTDFIMKKLISDGAYEIKGSYLDMRGVFKDQKYNDTLIYSFDKRKNDVNSYEGLILSHSQVAFSSTGEGIISRLGNGLAILGATIRSKENTGKKLWVFFDDCDAGTSLDIIGDIKSVLNLVAQDCKDNNITLTIVLTANSYEMCRSGCKCIDVYDFSEKTFATYEDYKKFVLKSRKRKEKSYGTGE